MMDPDRAQDILWDLHRGGLKIAIDDFGTGYSSLSRLREMPVDLLKIDRSFVSNVSHDQQSASIVGAFLELARGLGMTTLAEGIETSEELAFLRERGCSLGQGFLFSKPVPPEEIIAFSFGGRAGLLRPGRSLAGRRTVSGRRPRRGPCWRCRRRRFPPTLASPRPFPSPACPARRA